MNHSFNIQFGEDMYTLSHLYHTISLKILFTTSTENLTMRCHCWPFLSGYENVANLAALLRFLFSATNRGYCYNGGLLRTKL